MFEKDIEERMEALEKRLENLSAEVEANKKNQEEEVTLIPGAEYDFVPSVEHKVIARGVAKFVRFVEAPQGLGLSQQEWEQFTPDEECDE